MAKQKILGQVSATINGHKSILLDAVPPITLSFNSLENSYTISGELATTSTAGLMSHTDKIKLDNAAVDVTDLKNNYESKLTNSQTIQSILTRLTVLENALNNS